MQEQVEHAATKINSDSSTEWKTRWNGTNRATRRAVRRTPPPAGGDGHPDIVGVAHLRQPGVVPGDVHEVVPHLVQGHQQTEQQAGTDPDPAGPELAGSPDAEGDRDPALGDVVADPVEIDACR